ncbi:AGE family epimerase/isomerase [Lacihabitans soyangensis]|uniref:Cellobiose 2-epimerase n=1 Tax=Lacihabitans soyangensis TaxID=869394 RepID=A0AAE3H769_9BACT|nr:AGE family epimerase/isomerase [Lacihabitans soyangensis]MCP9765687.1 N-acyl-D-glucosamine 2-epimerase [Lacihabitans soyangensis]
MLSESFKVEIQSELDNILKFWVLHSIDEEYGGFIGKMDSKGKIFQKSPKGAVLNARILWTFSAAFNETNNLEYLELARRAYHYIQKCFRDNQYNGVFWSVDFQGNPLDTRKQIYGQAFTIYGLAEYYKITKDLSALQFAKELFYFIEKYSFDPINGGYLEAFAENWEPLEDLRLSEKDRNDPKTMNTHLHILEAYSKLYSVWKSDFLESQIRKLLNVFSEKIIDKSTNHLQLFFDEKWKPQSAVISFGHDIEATWLFLEAAETLNDDELFKQFSSIAIKMAEATKEGLQIDGSLLHEFDSSINHFETHREWWVSAEAMVGFLNAYKIEPKATYLSIVQDLWSFTKVNLIDQKQGEWFWGVFDDYSPMKDEDKIGFWKCPYHNARACMEIIRRLEILEYAIS